MFNSQSIHQIPTCGTLRKLHPREKVMDYPALKANFLKVVACLNTSVHTKLSSAAEWLNIKAVNIGSLFHDPQMHLRLPTVPEKWFIVYWKS